MALLIAVSAPATADRRRDLQDKIDSDDFGLPAPDVLGEPLRVWATWYNVPVTDATAHGFRLLNVAGEPISPPIRGREWCQAALQGVISIKSADGAERTYTYETSVPSSEVDCVRYFRHRANWIEAAGHSRFGISIGPFGDGAGGYQVVPYRTIAVDTRFIRLGTVIYIPAARGVQITLPSGRKVLHDGYFFASDRGGDIRGRHVDVFVGHTMENPFPSFITNDPLGRFDAYIIVDERVTPRLRELHRLD